MVGLQKATSKSSATGELHNKNPRKFERLKLFNVGDSEEFGVRYYMKFGKQNIDTSKKFLVNLLGDYCWEFVVELERSLMQKKNHDSHKSDVRSI